MAKLKLVRMKTKKIKKYSKSKISSSQEEDDEQEIALSQSDQKGEDTDENQQFDPIFIHLIESFQPILPSVNYIIPVTPSWESLTSNIIGNIRLIIGPQQSGKTCLIHWALRKQPQVKIVKIDCRTYSSEQQFVRKVCFLIGQSIERQLKEEIKKVQDCDFKQLNNVLLKSQVRMAIVIKNAQILTKAKRQVLLYNICDWMKTKVSQRIGLVIMSNQTEFTQHLQKRVRSRMTASIYRFYRPSGEQIYKIILARLSYAQQKFIKTITKGRKGQLEIKDHEQISRADISISNLKRIFQSNQNKLVKVLKDRQDRCAQSIPFYFNMMKLFFMRRITSCAQLEDLKQHQQSELFSSFLSNRITQVGYSVLEIGKRKIQKASLPEQILLAIIRNFFKNQLNGYYERITLKILYREYKLEYKNFINQSFGVGSSQAYTQSQIEQAMYKLLQNQYVKFNSREETFWNCEISVEYSFDELSEMLMGIKNKNMPEIFNRIFN